MSNQVEIAATEEKTICVSLRDIALNRAVEDVAKQDAVRVVATETVLTDDELFRIHDRGPNRRITDLVSDHPTAVTVHVVNAEAGVGHPIVFDQHA